MSEFSARCCEEFVQADVLDVELVENELVTNDELKSAPEDAECDKTAFWLA